MFLAPLPPAAKWPHIPLSTFMHPSMLFFTYPCALLCASTCTCACTFVYFCTPFHMPLRTLHTSIPAHRHAFRSIVCKEISPELHFISMRMRTEKPDMVQNFWREDALRGRNLFFTGILITNSKTKVVVVIYISEQGRRTLVGTIFDVRRLRETTT